MPFHDLYVLYHLFPDKPWNYQYVCETLELDLDTILSHPTRFHWSFALKYHPITDKLVSLLETNCDKSMLSTNRNVTLETVYRYPDVFNFDCLSTKHSISIEIVKSHLDKKWNWTQLSCNPSISIEDILSHPHLPWDWTTVSVHPNLRWKTIVDNPHLPWDWHGVSWVDDLDVEFVLLHPDYNWWYCYVLSCHPRITMDIVNRLDSKPWSWIRLSSNPGITWNDISSNLDRKWDWARVALNPNVTWEIIHQNLHLFDHSAFSITISKNSRLVTWETVVNFPHCPWDWKQLSQNANITWEIIRDNPDKPWCWIGISNNPNITWQIIRDNPDRSWCWTILSFKSSTLRNSIVRIQRFVRSRQRQIQKHKMRLASIVSTMVLEWYYSPNGPGYQEAKTHFESNVKN